MYVAYLFVGQYLCNMKKMHRSSEDLWVSISRKEKINYCGVRAFLEIMGGKWKFLIYSTLIEGPVRYKDLLAKIPQASEKMVLTSLRDLEEHKIVERIIYNEVPQRVEYEISEYGKSLHSILRTIENWGNEHILNYPDTIYFE
ncbi:MAG: helix-turn-helix transcriptional regulator [Cyclobacteriaceae bacterium]|nr:helix-turn-helix transcriptional regulator [Cyclobacteriaceae bacterium]